MGSNPEVALRQLEKAAREMHIWAPLFALLPYKNKINGIQLVFKGPVQSLLPLCDVIPVETGCWRIK